MPPRRISLADVYAHLGVAFVVIGAAQVYAPAAWIVAGCGLVYFAHRM